ncbi:Asp-tRNA(Asn)/Glu-tRNA(Gln) amidotransferase subunit GatC [Patescibacteria group bacterium]
MKLTDEHIQHIAKLARLQISDQDLKMYRDQISSILEYVETLQELNTDNVDELAYGADQINVMRSDEVKSCEPEIKQRIIDEFPNREGDLLKVQAVFEDRTE